MSGWSCTGKRWLLSCAGCVHSNALNRDERNVNNVININNNQEKQTPLIVPKFVEEKKLPNEELLIIPDIAEDPPIINGVKSRVLTTSKSIRNSAPGTPITHQKTSTPIGNKLEVGKTPDFLVDESASVKRNSLASITSSHTSRTTSESDVFLPGPAVSSDTDMNIRSLKSPQFTLKPQSKVAEEGKGISFKCKVSAQPMPTVDWYKGAVKLRGSERVRVENLPSGESILELEDLRPTDAGSYRCVATNTAGKASCSVELILTAKESVSQMAQDRPPAFSQSLLPAEVRVGNRIRFECKVEGRPKPTVVWNKDGKVVSASSRVRIMEVYGTHSLVISRTEAADSGVYSITASNHVGSDSCSAQLHIQDIATSRGSSSSQLSAYGISTSSDRSSPNTSNLSSPSLSPKLGRAITSRPVSGNSSPWASGVKTGGGGPPPRRRGPGFILRPRPQTAAAGDRLCLKCTLLGNPKPTVTWEKDGELVDEERTNGHIQTRNDGNDYFLEIEESCTDDAGKYTVTARNSLGKQTASVEVTITGGSPSVKTTKGKSSPATNNKSNHVANDNATHDATPNSNKNISSTAQPGDENVRPARIGELILPSNAKPDDSKDSPTGSISSTMSSHSRISTSSSRSNASVKQEQEAAEKEEHTAPASSYTRSSRSWRRSYVAPTFTRRLSSTQVLEGEELLLQCEVSGEPEPELRWMRNGIEVGIDEDEVFTSFRNGIARLRLRDLQATHAGEYICKARNEAGVIQCSSRVTVKVKPVVTRPRFLRALSDVRVTEGDTLTLEAEVDGSPTPEILWSLDGEEISNAECSFNKSIAKLTVYNVTHARSGQYMCNALNSGGEDSVACRVRVKAKKTDITPEFTAPLSDVKAVENDDVCLRCMVTGIPEPSVKWMYNEELLEPEEGVEISYHDGVAALTLEQATDEDTGTYTCVAVNSEGQAKTSCQVSVTAAKKPEKKAAPSSPPKFTTLFDEYLRTQEGDTLTLECTISGSPLPSVKWTANDQPLEEATSEVNGDKVQLVINPVTSSHSGHVKCTIQNSAGTASHEARIYVRSKRVAPSFDTDLPSTIEVQEGAEASFECRVTGHPQPRVTWTRDGRSLSILTTETTYEDGVAAVRIRKAGPREGGKYICTARNLSGESQSICTVIVSQQKKEETPKKPTKSAPSFTKQLGDMTLEDGQDLKLICNVTGTPTPEITWFLDGLPLEAEDGDATFSDGVAMMVLEDVMQDDSGKYKCVATNSAGSVETSCKVTVKGPAKKEPEKPKDTDPSFPIVLEDKTIKEGDDIVLKCKVIGQPRPKITWLLDGEEILDAELKYEEDGNIELLLPEALPEDEGVYTCIAENPLKRVMSSCTVTIEAPPKQPKKKSAPAPKQDEPVAKPVDVSPAKKTGSQVKPAFIDGLTDVTVADGSTSFKLSCKVEGKPSPVARWFFDGEEKENNEDFRIVSSGDDRTLIFTEVFPEDSGTYSCVISNSAGEATSKCKITVEEIDGEAPSFIMKPKPVNVNGGEKAVFSCRVDGDPSPSVQWLFCNRPIQDLDRIHISEANQSNNYTHSLEIPIVSPQDAGRYSACCRNLLGDVTCTVSLIVSDAKRQDACTDFRGVLKKTKSPTSPKATSEEQVDFRSVLRSTSADRDLGRRGDSTGSENSGEDPGMIYKEALTTTVKTKALTEEERKRMKAEQKDFRSNLVRTVVNPEHAETKTDVKSRGPEQKDFRDEALKTKVQTKALGQEDYKIMHGEQKDFRSETIKSKVVTKSYNEDLVKAKRAEQKDFRNVLSPTKREGDEDKHKDTEHGGTLKLAELPKAKWKKGSTMDHNTVATKRSRRREVVPERKIQQNGDEQDEEPVGTKPQFVQPLADMENKDGEPFELVCHVTGEPRPEITWFLEDEEVKAEADIAITYEGDVCRLSVTESFPEDQGRYSCTARNDHGQVTCSCYVTVLTEEPPPDSGTSKYAKKKSTSSQNSIKPAEVTDGPRDTTVVRGNPISLCCALTGTSPLKVVWRKGRDEIKHSSQCNIETTRFLSALTIAKSERDDSGCYTLQVTNSAGVDQFSVSVKVVDVPDPPGKPFAQSGTGDTIVVSWYGSGYDGGSPIKSYILEMCKVRENGSGNKVWSEVASTNSTSHAVNGLEKNAAYMFRVSAENLYGASKPGATSDIVRNVQVTMENGADSSSEEEDESTFVKYGAVKIRQNQRFSTKYEIHEKLGQGRFGKVHRVTDRETGNHYAAKIMRALKAKDKEAVSLEIEIMNKLRHPKLVQLIDAFSHGREITMVMDLVAGGELFERVIDEDFELTEAVCIKYMRQICAGVQFMHNSSIVHLDLKPENIMCINKTGTQIKLIDFGLARKFNPSEPIRVMFGTPEFVAPEVINYDAIGFQTDMWSVGVICYILLSGLSPFSGDADSETLSNITAVKWDFDDEAFDQISNDAKDFISHLLVKSLKNRYNVDKALQHKWLKNDLKQMSKSKLNTKNLKRFLARRKWQKTGNAVRALGRLASLARLPTSNSGASNGQRESGFLSALKAQLVREKESEQAPGKRKPEFVQTFDDVEVVEGSAAKFECTVTGVPDPEIIWYIDGDPIKQSRHFRISYTEDDVCTLLITEAGEHDEAEYTCKAMNSEGAVEHSAELTVIMPGV
uniref:Myosin light chain kinase, smooth muscle n=1 Tax=Phallusia mammillata TaxID=59560 RepID=A0A6F9DL23_9ASCI|nr:myosin light chain kinase, smooth muscle [Phallusia mammillata]